MFVTLFALSVACAQYAQIELQFGLPCTPMRFSMPGMKTGYLRYFDPWIAAQSNRTTEGEWLVERFAELHGRHKDLPEVARAAKYIKEGQMMKAILELTLDSEPPIHLLFAQLLAESNLPRNALRVLEIHGSRYGSPQDPEDYVVLGDVALRNKRVVEADLLYSKAEDMLKTFDMNQDRKKTLRNAVLIGRRGIGNYGGPAVNSQRNELLIILENVQNNKDIKDLHEGALTLAPFNNLSNDAIIPLSFAEKQGPSVGVTMMERALEKSGGELSTQIAAAEVIYEPRNWLNRAITRTRH
jgi:hypothetical protein